MAPIVSAPTYKDPVTGGVHKCDGLRREIITPLEIVGWLHAHMTPFLTYAILDRRVKNLDHLVAIKKDRGLTREIAEKVIWHLNTIND